MRTFHQIVLLLVVGILAAYWQWMLVGVVLAFIARAFSIAYREHRTEQLARARARAELAARADEQDRWYIEGDPRGTFGTV